MEWVKADQVLGAVGIAPPGTPAQAQRAALVSAAINTGMARFLDRPNPDSDPTLLAGLPELEAAALTAAITAYRRFDTAFDSVNYGDMNQASLAPKVARDALSAVLPQLERWRWVAIG